MCALLFLSTFSVIFTVFAAPTTGDDMYDKILSGEIVVVDEDELTTEQTTDNNQKTNAGSSETTVATEESTTVPPEVPSQNGETVTEKLTENTTEKNNTPTPGETDIALVLPENATIVTLDINKDYGNIPIIFKNVSNKKEYEVILKYREGEGYFGTTMMPIGKYEIKAGEKDDIRLSLNEKTIEFRNYEEIISITHRKIENRTAPKFWNFIKNNILLFVLFGGAVGIYIYIRYKNRIED